MSNYIDLLPNDVSELIYKKKFNLELLDELKNCPRPCYNNNKFKFEKKKEFKIGDKVDGRIKDRHCNRKSLDGGIITKFTKCYIFIDYKNDNYRVKKDDVTKWFPPQIKIPRRCLYLYYEDSGSVWYKPNPIRDKYSEYLDDHWVNSITELRLDNSNPMVGMDNPYLTLYLEYHHPELNIVWDKKTHPNFRG